MVRSRVTLYRDRVRRELVAAFQEEHTDREVAASFAIGIFITAMPTGGLGLGLFVLLAYWWSWISKTAIFASVVVMNPIVKPAVYVASYSLGALLFGTEPVVATENATLEAVVMIGVLILVGNLIIATVLAVVSYITVLHLTRVHRRYRKSGQSASAASNTSLAFWRRK